MGRRRKTRGRTRVFIVQDKSGSMDDLRSETIGGFNEYVDELERTTDGRIDISLTQFDTSVFQKYVNRPLSETPSLTPEDYVPGGMTALYDAIAKSIRSAEVSVSSNDKVIVVIMTDGGENSSVEYNRYQGGHDRILRLIQGKRGDGWDFVFLGAGEEAWQAGRDLGFVGQFAPAAINYGKWDHHDHLVTYTALASSTADAHNHGGETVFDADIKRSLESKAVKK